MANYKQQLDNSLRTFQKGGNVKKPSPQKGSRKNANGTQYTTGEVDGKYGSISYFISK